MNKLFAILIAVLFLAFGMMWTWVAYDMDYKAREIAGLVRLINEPSYQREMAEMAVWNKKPIPKFESKDIIVIPPTVATFSNFSIAPDCTDKINQTFRLVDSEHLWIVHCGEEFKFTAPSKFEQWILRRKDWHVERVK
jgi:hypothetical protein